MARELDLIIFGATGFTGKHCIPIVQKLAKTEGRNLTWGIAGRSEKKLKEVLSEYEKILESVDSVPIIIADVEDYESLKKMAQKARVIINCCGPYRFYGEQVVKACVEEGTNHVDVSGEPQFIEKMQLKYNKGAQEKGIFIVSACGLDSIPADLGVVFLQEKFEGTLNSVTTFLQAWQEGGAPSGASVNFGTWESAVYGLAHGDELRELRTQLYPTRMPKFAPKLEAKSLPHKSDVVEGWVLPFLGSDKSVVRRSQRYFYEKENKRPVQVETYFVLKSFVHVFILGIFALIFGLLARFEIGRNLLLNYPEKFSNGFFSRTPPPEELVEKCWFSIDFYGEGWKEKLSGPDDKYSTPVNQAIRARVKGRNPGYGATCVALVLSAIMVLTEKDKMPAGGGVLPPGAAFAKTSLIKQLDKNGVTFEVLSQKDL